MLFEKHFCSSKIPEKFERYEILIIIDPFKFNYSFFKCAISLDSCPFELIKGSKLIFTLPITMIQH